jgi:hypothetical protein
MQRKAISTDAQWAFEVRAARLCRPLIAKPSCYGSINHVRQGKLIDTS